MRLADRVAIVTGGSRGIGRAYAERFLREGASVVIADVDDASGATTTAELRDLGAVEYVHCDVSDAASAETCVRESLEHFRRIDILVNNAALYGDWEMANQSFDYLKRVFDVNLHGVWLMTRAVAPQMVDQEYGRIVNQASAAAYNYRVPVPVGDFGGLNAFNYQQTKWGVVGLTKFSAAQLGRWNITVNCIAPGVIATEATLKVVPQPMLETLAEQQAVPGLLHADDLTGSAVFFATEEARFVTGQVLVVDGGKYMPA
jgi:NAD(P)-dependent dehydrogenase (short-subunit alcohol dehydrogenase family)